MRTDLTTDATTTITPGLKCGKVFDVEMDYIKDLEKQIKEAHGFQFSGHDLMFKGICPDCQKKEK